MKLLVILVVALAIVAVAQLAKVSELGRALKSRAEDDHDTPENKLNANLMLVWLTVLSLSTLYLCINYGNYLPEAASEHGKALDLLMDVNLWIVIIMFFIMNGLLHIVAWKYRFRKGRKGWWFPHNNSLEMVWTLIPATIIAVIVVFGLLTWNKIMSPATADTLKIEIYSKQFDWTARYSGADEAFGMVNVNLISNDNAMGIVSREAITSKLASLDEEIAEIAVRLDENKATPILPKSYVEAQEEKLYKLQRHKQRLMDLKETKVGENGVSDWLAGADDQIIKGEVHIPLGKEVEFIFRSQDVIHSAYLPHFRAQMNTVPGQATRFKMTPTITTEAMRKKLKNDEFDYLIICNKVCGSAHFNMQMKVVVESPGEYEAWLKTVKPFKPQVETAANATEPDTQQETIQ